MQDSGVAIYYMVAVGSLTGLLEKLQARSIGRGIVLIFGLEE